MRGESEAALRELIEAPNRLLESAMMNAPVGASEPSEEVLTALIDLDGLISELEYLRDNRLDSDEPDTPVAVPLNPLPLLNSGAVALPEPDFE